MVKKRRGRRKNVEGMDLLSFMNKSRVPAVPDQVVLCSSSSLIVVFRSGF